MRVPGRSFCKLSSHTIAATPRRLHAAPSSEQPPNKQELESQRHSEDKDEFTFQANREGSGCSSLQPVLGCAFRILVWRFQGRFRVILNHLTILAGIPQFVSVRINVLGALTSGKLSLGRLMFLHWARSCWAELAFRLL